MKMNTGYYRIYGMVLKSTLELPELSKAPVGRADWSFRLAKARITDAERGPWYYAWRLPGGRVGMRAARTGNGYLMRFPGIADFRVNNAGRSIAGHARNGTPIETLRHLLLDQVLPWTLSLRGRLVLHAGAVKIGGGAIAFVGDTGQGKSTLCASFKRAGYPVLTDDGLLLDRRHSGYRCLPSYPGLRLWRDSLRFVFKGAAKEKFVRLYAGKKRLVIGTSNRPHAVGARPLLRIYFLTTPAKARNPKNPLRISIERPSAQEAFLSLFRQTFRLELADPRLARREFRALSRLASMPIIRSLNYPRSFGRLPAVRKAILHDLTS